MAEWFAKLAELLTLPTKPIAAVALVTGALLFAPRNLLDRLYLGAIVSNFGPYLGVAFIGTSALLAVEFFWWIAGVIKEKREESRAREQTLKSLQVLDNAERAVLQRFVLQGQNTIYLFATDPVVAGLIEKGILEQVGPYGRHSREGIALPFTVPHELREKLTPEFLGERPSSVRALDRRRTRRGF